MTLTTKDLQKLNTCDPQLQLLVKELSTEMPITVLCGMRDKEDQDKAVTEGHSKTPYPTSKHNSNPSQAVDVAPLPLNWNDLDSFNKMLDAAERIAEKLGIELRLGRTFSFRDFPHIELAQNSKRG